MKLNPTSTLSFWLMLLPTTKYETGEEIRACSRRDLVTFATTSSTPPQPPQRDPQRGRAKSNPPRHYRNPKQPLLIRVPQQYHWFISTWKITRSPKMIQIWVLVIGVLDQRLWWLARRGFGLDGFSLLSSHFFLWFD